MVTELIPNTRFRTSWTSRAGLKPSYTIQGKVVNVNLVNWTVDVRSQFDGLFFGDIQVASPYLHYSNGEGISCLPEVGAKCFVTAPSDSSPMFVSSFIMPVENIDMSSEEAPMGIGSPSSPGSAVPSSASFAGGRPRVTPGDICLRTRDDNFIVLHRGGVLQLGATELAQRIYIPLQHIIMDIAQQYAHHNSGGSIHWGLQDISSDLLPTEYTHAFRVFADTNTADVRVKVGKVSGEVTESFSDFREDQSDLSLGSDYIVYEVCIAPGGFDADTGELTNPHKTTVMHFFFDHNGGAFLRCDSAIFIGTKRTLRVRAKEGIELYSDRGIVLEAKTGLTIDGGISTHVKGTIIRLGGGFTPIALQGGVVQVTLPFTPMIAKMDPYPQPLMGTITSGSGQVMA